MTQWVQNYDPLANAWLSTLAAAVPVLVLFYLLAVAKVKAHLAAFAALAAAILTGLLIFHMPGTMLAAAVADGLVYGAISIAWVLLVAVFVYELTLETGHFEVIKASIGGVTNDRRLQVLLIAFAFGAVLEGAGGGGAPVAISGAMMVGLGFPPFEAAALCLIANSSPVAFGGVGNPIRALVAVTGLSDADLSAMVGRILPWTALLLPFWLTRSTNSWTNTVAVWPALLVAGGVFAGIQFYWSNYQDGALVDIVGGMTTLLLLAVFLKFWKPARQVGYSSAAVTPKANTQTYRTREVLHAWSPFLLLAILVIVWGMPSVKKVLDHTTLRVPVPGLNMSVVRVPPVVAAPRAEPALFEIAWLSNPGSATFLAGLIAGPMLSLSFRATIAVFFRTLYRMRWSLGAILAMLALGFVIRYCGMDAVLGLAMTHTGRLFPFFGTLVGWIGVALSGTDAGSNALFGSLQVITANRLGISPVLMASANSCGGVMGKMIGAQSLIVAAAAVDQQGKEGDLLRAVLPHSILLASLIGLIVCFYAYWGQAWIPMGRVWAK